MKIKQTKILTRTSLPIKEWYKSKIEMNHVDESWWVDFRRVQTDDVTEPKCFDAKRHFYTGHCYDSLRCEN